MKLLSREQDFQQLHEYQGSVEEVDLVLEEDEIIYCRPENAGEGRPLGPRLPQEVNRLAFHVRSEKKGESLNIDKVLA